MSIWVSALCLFGIARTAAATSSTETGRKPENTQSVDVNTGEAALHVWIVGPVQSDIKIARDHYAVSVTRH